MHSLQFCSGHSGHSTLEASGAIYAQPLDARPPTHSAMPHGDVPEMHRLPACPPAGIREDCLSSDFGTLTPRIVYWNVDHSGAICYNDKW